MRINRIASLFAVALSIAATAAHAGQILTDNFTVPVASDPNINPSDLNFNNTDWFVTSGTGQLTMGVTATGASQLSAAQWDQGPSLELYTSSPNSVSVPAGEDFVASVTISLSNATSATGGFYFSTDSPSNPYFGLQSATWGLSASDAIGGNPYAPSITSGTFQLIREGDTFTSQYEETGSDQFTTLVSFSNPGVEGNVYGFDLQIDLNDNPGAYPNYVTFSNFSVTSSVPDGGATAIMLGAALTGLAMLRRRLAK